MRKWLKPIGDELFPREGELSAGDQPLDQVEEARPEPLIEEEERQKAA
jgi:hypothetical protein